LPPFWSQRLRSLAAWGNSIWACWKIIQILIHTSSNIRRIPFWKPENQFGQVSHGLQSFLPSFGASIRQVGLFGSCQQVKYVEWGAKIMGRRLYSYVLLCI
jgi:hypothetical protein